MMKFVVFVIFLIILGTCTKCKGSPTLFRRNKRQANSGCSNTLSGVPLELSKQLTVTFNGAEANRGAYPWQVGIYKKINNDESFRCGGTIISENIVISAAHCFTTSTGETYPVTSFKIGAGKLFSDWNALEDENFVQKRNVLKIDVPVSYLGLASNYASDIALVVVTEPFVISNYVRPVCIDKNSEYVDEQLKSGNIGQVSGWGASGPDYHKASPLLKQYKFPYVDISQCHGIVPPTFRKFISTDKYCAGYTNGTSVCNGDGGNGMIFSKQNKYYIQGIVSLGVQNVASCNQNQLAAYTKLSIHMTWIKNIIESNRGTGDKSHL